MIILLIVGFSHANINFFQSFVKGFLAFHHFDKYHRSIYHMIRFLKKAASYIFLIPIYLYRLIISPFLPSSCIYRPSCSQYAVESIKQHGVIKGLILAVTRITRCHGLYEGGNDPVPERFSWKHIREKYRRKPKNGKSHG